MLGAFLALCPYLLPLSFISGWSCFIPYRSLSLSLHGSLKLSWKHNISVILIPHTSMMPWWLIEWSRYSIIHALMDAFLCWTNFTRDWNRNPSVGKFWTKSAKRYLTIHMSFIVGRSRFHQVFLYLCPLLLPLSSIVGRSCFNPSRSPLRLLPRLLEHLWQPPSVKVLWTKMAPFCLVSIVYHFFATVKRDRME